MKNVIKKNYNYFHYCVIALISTSLLLNFYFLIFSSYNGKFLINRAFYILIIFVILVSIIKKYILPGYCFSTFFFTHLSFSYISLIISSMSSNVVYIIDSNPINKINFTVNFFIAILSFIIWWKVYSLKFSFKKT